LEEGLFSGEKEMNLMETIYELTKHGTDARKLMAQLKLDFPSSTSHDLKQALITMIIAGELIEIEYQLPFRDGNDSLILPKGTAIRGISMRSK
jgi:hypothetical protein